MATWEYGRLVRLYAPGLHEVSWELANPEDSDSDVGSGEDWFSWFHQLGVQGWEFVSMSEELLAEHHGESYYIFKRQSA